MALTVKQLREIADLIKEKTAGLNDGRLVMTSAKDPSDGESKYCVGTYGGWVDLSQLVTMGESAKSKDNSIRKMCESAF